MNGAVVHPQICPHVEAVSRRRGGCVFRASPRRDLNNTLRIKERPFHTNANPSRVWEFVTRGRPRSTGAGMLGRVTTIAGFQNIGPLWAAAFPPRAHLDHQMEGPGASPTARNPRWRGAVWCVPGGERRTQGDRESPTREVHGTWRDRQSGWTGGQWRGGG